MSANDKYRHRQVRPVVMDGSGDAVTNALMLLLIVMIVAYLLLVATHGWVWWA